MDIIKFILTFLTGFGTILICDTVWLGYIVKRFTIAEFGTLIVVEENGSIKINLAAGMLAWSAIVLLVYVFVLKSGYAQGYGSALLWWAVIWGLSYAMYDFTNLTFLKWYSLSFTLVDIIWGIFLCAMVSLSMYVVDHYLTKVL